MKKESLKHNISRITFLLTLTAMPFVTFAQGTATVGPTKDLNGLVTKAVGYFNLAIYFIIALAIVTFVWNVYNYFIVKDPSEKKDASLYVMYSVIGIFVIISLWGLVNILSNTFNLENTPGTVNVTNLIGNIAGGNGGSNPTF